MAAEEKDGNCGHSGRTETETDKGTDEETRADREIERQRMEGEWKSEKTEEEEQNMGLIE